MQDQKFLHQALEHSFLHPQLGKADAVLLTDNTALIDLYYLTYPSCPALPPYFATKSQLAKYLPYLPSVISKRRNSRLYDELDALKHDMAENIIIPSDFPETAALCSSLDMPELNRRSAQKKKVSATIFPARLAADIKSVRSKFFNDTAQVELLLSQHLACKDYMLISNYADTYKRCYRQICANLFLRLNRRRFLCYLNEAAQLLKSSLCIDEDDFISTHTFIGEHFNFCRFRLTELRGCFRQLLTLLKTLAHNQQLLTLAQKLLIGEPVFSEELQQYLRQHNITKPQPINRLRRTLQNYYNCYIRLIYLNGVRCSFEQQLDNYPQTQPQPLPSVSPRDEIKKIIEIVAESKKITAVDGKLNRHYNRIMQDYQTACRQFASVFNAFSSTFNK